MFLLQLSLIYEGKGHMRKLGTNMLGIRISVCVFVSLVNSCSFCIVMLLVE